MKILIGAHVIIEHCSYLQAASTLLETTFQIDRSASRFPRLRHEPIPHPAHCLQILRIPRIILNVAA